MNPELPIGTIVSFKKNLWDKIQPEQGMATICGYDICHTKYHAIKHSFDNRPMPSVKVWLFQNEVINHP